MEFLSKLSVSSLNDFQPIFLDLASRIVFQFPVIQILSIIGVRVQGENFIFHDIRQVILDIIVEFPIDLQLIRPST